MPIGSPKPPTATQRLFSPLQLGSVWVPNRIAMTASPSGYAGLDGFASDQFADYYAERALGGVGMLVIEPTCVIPPPHRTLPHIGLYADVQVPGLHQCISTVRHTGAVALVMLDQQLWLAQLKSNEIATIGEAFIAAAWRARAAGADGIMLSTADGGPFEQLISPLQNQRTDDYGSDADKRLRLLLDVIEGIRRWIGDQFVLGVRVNVEAFTPGGLTLQDTRVIAKRLVSAGVTFLEICANTSADVPVAQFPGWRVPLAAGVKAVVDVPIMVGGLLDNAELADSIIRDNSADIVALTERLRVEPDWPQRARAALAQNDTPTPAPPE